jgi:hypothetical protein
MKGHPGNFLGTGSVAALLVAALVLVSSPTTASGASPSSELLYVANANSGPVTAYSPSASGAVRPVRLVKDPNTKGSFWDPWGVAFDQDGNLYVQTYLSDATTFVFAPGASHPTRIFESIGPDIASVAIDPSGYEYLIGGEGPPDIAVDPPGAQGTSANSYHVNPLRIIHTDASDYNTWPSVLATDRSGDVLASVLRSGGNAVEVYQGGPTGSADPLRTISGPKTGLGTCTGFSTCTDVSITTAGNLIYALVSSAAGVHLSVFPLDGSGDVAPLRTIQGSQTGFPDRVGTGLAVSRANGLVYVLVKKAQFSGPGEIEVFAAGASGNTAPIRTFTDAHTHLVDGESIALG